MNHARLFRQKFPCESSFARAAILITACS
jgi:hypothetical protein